MNTSAYRRGAIGALSAAVCALVVAGGAFAAGNGTTSGIHDTRKSVDRPCTESMTMQNEGTFNYNGPNSIWPPNHKYRTVTITLTDGDAEPIADDVTLRVTASHDQILADMTEMLGSGGTDPLYDITDANGNPAPTQTATGTGSASVTFKIRGERSGQDKTGRTYTFTTEAMGMHSKTDSGVSDCQPVTYTATVPHDQRNQDNTGTGAASTSISTRR